jgi:hypothetical protein
MHKYQPLSLNAGCWCTERRHCTAIMSVLAARHQFSLLCLRATKLNGCIVNTDDYVVACEGQVVSLRCHLRSKYYQPMYAGKRPFIHQLHLV